MHLDMDINHILQECRIDSVLDSLNIKSQSAKELFKSQAKLWTTELNILKGRSDAWQRLKSLDSENWKKHLVHLLENEKIIRSIDPAIASDSQKEDWSQILFTGNYESLNFIPFLLMYVAMSKIFLAPLIAWTMPIFSIILPYFALQYMYNIPITWEQYWETMKPMIFGKNEGPMQLSTMLQWISMFVSYAHGMYLPYTNAIHCYKIDQLILKTSFAIKDTIQRLKEISDIWISYGIRKPWSFPDITVYGDERQIVASILNDSQLVPDLYRAIGRVEITAAIQNSESLVPVKWVQSGTPYCKMVGAVDTLLSEKLRVPFTLIMGPTEHHAICTGPNRGGKSTFLRSALTNLILAHAWGVAFAKRCILTPVEWIISSLRLEDHPGQESLFEREVNVAGEVLERLRLGNTRGWVVIDELFHTTNPPDAATASQVFLRQLWDSKRAASIISTHLFSHAITAPVNVQRLCVESEFLDLTGKIKYTYMVTRGINTMSSVKELLLESNILGNLDAFLTPLKTSQDAIDNNE